MMGILDSFIYFLRKNRTVILKTIIISSFLSLLVMISLWSEELSYSIKRVIMAISEKGNFFLYSSISMGLITLFVSVMASYLNKGIDSKKIERGNTEAFIELIRLKERVAKIENKPSSGVSVDLKESDREELISYAKKRIIGNTILQADLSLKTDISNFKNSYSLHKIHTDLVQRLKSEIDRLNRRGGVNLAIGSIIALIGILSLAYFLYRAPDIVGGLDFFIHQLPKLSFVIAVELFAYFFLRLYKNGFDEIKYFQNEITNIDMKVMSLKYAQEFNSEDIIRELAMHLMKTERNFILENGQTTVSIEKDRLQNISDSKLTSVISEIIKLKEK